jgi:hypothetical protein
MQLDIHPHIANGTTSREPVAYSTISDQEGIINFPVSKATGFRYHSDALGIQQRSSGKTLAIRCAVLPLQARSWGEATHRIPRLDRILLECADGERCPQLGIINMSCLNMSRQNVRVGTTHFLAGCC